MIRNKVQRSPRGAASTNKTAIIIAFVVGFLGLVAFFGPLMISSSALTMAGIDIAAGDLNSAKEHLKIAIQTNPHSSLAYQYRGYLYSQLQQPAPAMADFTTAIEYGASGDSIFGRAFQHHLSGQFDLALQDYKSALDKNPAKKSDIYVNQADVLYRLNRVKESVAACDKAIAEDPHNATARLNRSQAYVRLGRYQAAIDDLDVAIDNSKLQQISNPDLKRDSYLMRSIAYGDLGNTTDADADLLEAGKAAHTRHMLTIEAREAEPYFSQKVQKKYFTLCTSSEAPKAQEYANRWQSFLKFVNAHIAQVRTSRHLHIFAFANKQQYQSFIDDKKFKETLWEEEKGNAILQLRGSRYDVSRDSILSYSEDLIYPLTFKVLKDLPFADKWSAQGIASLLTHSYGYMASDEGQLYLPGNLGDYKMPSSAVPSLVEIINNSRQQPDDQLPMLAALFLFKKGKLQAYLDICRTGKMGDYPTVYEAALGRRAPELEPDWQKFIAELKAANTSATTVSRPDLFKTKDQFEEFKKEHPELQLLAL